MSGNVTGSWIIAVGTYALSNNTFSGSNIIIGNYDGNNYINTESNNICIGSAVNTGESNLARIGQGLTNKCISPPISIDTLYNIMYSSTTQEIVGVPKLYEFSPVSTCTMTGDIAIAFGDTVFSTSYTSSTPLTLYNHISLFISENITIDSSGV